MDRLGLAHAGTHSPNILALLLPVVADESVSMELASLAALSLGIVFTGSCNAEITTTIVETMMERSDKDLSEKWARFMALGLGLLYLGQSLFDSTDSGSVRLADGSGIIKAARINPMQPLNS